MESPIATESVPGLAVDQEIAETLQEAPTRISPKVPCIFRESHIFTGSPAFVPNVAKVDLVGQITSSAMPETTSECANTEMGGAFVPATRRS
mmetsp:Transcript_32514/g.66347  ORF Transcript_32514/g.66347 Transcript_32514/m.66347 type:complete len:92 (-) Transcript_32514:189-464(-)